MASSNRNWDQIASKVPTFSKQQKGFFEFVCADLFESELTPAKIIKQFRQEYEPVDLFFLYQIKILSVINAYVYSISWSLPSTYQNSRQG